MYLLLQLRLEIQQALTTSPSLVKSIQLMITHIWNTLPTSLLLKFTPHSNGFYDG